ncbi:pyridoxal phosphate-dependent aminotransferase [Epibacterium sp. Ofav1-8]|uniref:pyridoxal phosphate-dependent aminotransferase n=1 Tax=Epibacterium sp. Ofav1-8 TaxID=2917735 RepID=UPI001EF4CDA4|nr:pyridoxal phosphate-dependent aminotransferase [Epibacterium sp. Ofav1-8]MCG7625397.1 pyridoxal phosphate-dependent aminotransferase [Epibacterium sp. Ofav1-8]
MRTTSITQRLAGLGGAKWDLHLAARERAERGEQIIEMTIGEPDVPLPDVLADAAISALRAGRTQYSNGRGENGLRDALAEVYSARRGQLFDRDHVLCFPGTQTALYAVFQGVAEAGDEVLVGDPLYATYEGVIRATGAEMVSVPLRPEHGFRMQADDVASRITDRTRAILLNTPHNPTGAILRREDLEALADLARAHDLWLISDEVYEDLVFEGSSFLSPLSLPEVADRVIAVSSISKSHAAPGLRSGWAIGPKPFMTALLPVSETMLFGNQPFIADMTEQAVRNGSPVAEGMRQRFARRATYLADRLETETRLRVHRPEAGMFALVNVRPLGMDCDRFAWALLEQAGVAVMPGSSFGEHMQDWVRLALTIDDATLTQAVDRISEFATAVSAAAE